MAIRFTYSSTEYCQRTANLLDHNSTYTICCWVRPQTFSQACHIVTLQTALGNFTNQDSVVLSDAGALSVESNISGTGTPDTGSTLSTGTWYHVALVRSGDADLSLYLNGVLDATVTTNIAGRLSCGSIALGTFDGGSFNFDGRVSALKEWTRALTASEIASEMRCMRPVSPRSINGWWPFAVGNDTMRPKDWTFRGRDWTEVNTPTNEADPPIGWGEPMALVGATGSAAPTGQPTACRWAGVPFSPFRTRGIF